MTSEAPREKFIRAEKTTRNRDDYKVLLVGVIFGVFILVSQVTYGMLIDQRWFRDVTGITPFHSVKVMSQAVVDDSITVTGELVKRRCTFDSLTGYIIYDDLMSEDLDRQRVFVNTRPEEILTGITGNRPPSDEAENWGPWLMTLTLSTENLSHKGDIKGWEIWAHHSCPTRPVKQSNLFAEGLWTSFNSLEYLESPKLREVP